MSAAAFDTTELQELCWAQQAGELLPAEAARLEQLVTSNPEACDYYTRYLSLCAHLEWSATPCDEVCDRVVGNASKTVTIAAPSVVNLLSTAEHDSLISLPQGWLLAYAIATLTFAVGLLIGWMIPVSSPSQVAQSVPPPSESHAAPEIAVEYVGRITGMIDCRWADPHSAVAGGVAVPLGRHYALASGLMEITYDTGAKVILQGPVTYEVDSREGGYLSLGKLTARVDNASQNLSPKTQDPNP
jgi:hypothetical protein